jgi:hypothetical protein
VCGDLVEECEVFVAVNGTGFDEWEFTWASDDVRRVTSDAELFDECGIGGAVDFDGHDAGGECLLDGGIGKDCSFHALAWWALGPEDVDEQSGILGSGEFTCGLVVRVPATLLGGGVCLQCEQEDRKQQHLPENVHGAACGECNGWDLAGVVD